MKVSKTIDDHILQFPKEIQNKLQSIRQIIRTSAPDAVECIKYGIPTFTI